MAPTTRSILKKERTYELRSRSVLRDNHLFPKPDPLDGDDDDVVDELRRDGIRVVHGIPSTALFPPNVSLCEGFGFACMNQPVSV
ncbi:hypothetical protein ANCDUO_03147 [Ancylostoma duodenale]|uniref:Uncharacterized protein n=1 Tax=Ancylostoma duodenale TaxID=51022 RepID=A0A0C2H4R1_9BILA|nr:hypothetical protein ANCDUO_03147 [Ancylostoma duodenale]